MKIKNKRVVMSPALWQTVQALIRQFLNDKYVEEFEQNTENTRLRLKNTVFAEGKEGK